MTVRIIKGNCLDALREMPDRSVHCCVSSPPYWRQRDYGMAGQLGLETTPEEYIAKLVAVYREVNRVLRDDGTAWVNIGDKWASGANGGGKTNGTMKAVGGLTGSPHGRHSLGDNLPAKERRSNKQRGDSRTHAGFNDRWDAMEREGQIANGANLRSVWWISPAQYREGHYAVMPDMLAEICITAACPKGGVVLDPFGGAGTTGMVADRLGRNAILIELNPEYADMAKRRIEGDAGMFANVV